MVLCHGSPAQNYPVKPVGDQPEEFAAFIKADIEKWRKLVRQKGLKVE